MTLLSIDYPQIVWRAEEYHDLSFAQTVAAKALIKKLEITETHHVLDVGCGNGRISAKIAEAASGGSVLAIDKSNEMIAFATQKFPSKIYPNLLFKIEDAQDFYYTEQFDIVFSSFALQWVNHKANFFKNSCNALKDNGRLAFTIPLSISYELQEAVNVVINRPPWQNFFQDFHPGWFFSNKEEIKEIINRSMFNVIYSDSCLQEVVFSSKEDFEKYILLWFPYLRPLPQAKKKIFFAQVMDKYFSMLPIRSDGSALLFIPRMDLIAEK